MVQRYLPYIGDAPMVVAYALLDGLQLAEHVGCNRVMVNPDCMQVVNAFCDGFLEMSTTTIYGDCFQSGWVLVQYL
jgi:hypothetical protein